MENIIYGNVVLCRGEVNESRYRIKMQECGAEYPAVIQNTCYECFGPLEVNYDWDYISDQYQQEEELQPVKIHLEICRPTAP